MADQYRTIHYGLGPIGLAILKLAAGKERIRPLAAVDIAPEIAGRDAGEVAGMERSLGIIISADAGAALASDADVVIHCTGSYLDAVQPQLLAAVRAGKNVVSTCEELSYPWDRHPQLAADLDREAKAHGVTVLGTGVNPGFVMDTLALALSAVCQEVSHVTAVRVVDVSKRRIQLQRKVGAGLPLDEFQRRVAARTLRHVGLEESARLIAAGLGWKLDRAEETIEPVVAADGANAAGVHQTARAWMDGREVLLLDLVMEMGTGDPRDEIIIDGRPPIDVIVRGGVQGDLATAAIAVNAIPVVVGARPGLLTMAELPIVAAFGVGTRGQS
jgi:hypothetical protein